MEYLIAYLGLAFMCAPGLIMIIAVILDPNGGKL